MKETTAYQSSNAKLFSKKSEAMYEDLKEEIDFVVGKIDGLNTNVGSGAIALFIKGVLLQEYRGKDGKMQRFDVGEFAKQIKRLWKMYDAAIAQGEAERTAEAVQTPDPKEEEIPF